MVLSFLPTWVWSSSLWQLCLSILPVWILGALAGYLLPRPKNASTSSWPSLLTLLSPDLRKLALAVHGAVIIRDVWRAGAHVGTFRSLASASLRWLCGKGFELEVPAVSPAGSYPASAVPGNHSSAADEKHLIVDKDVDNWYVTAKDLAFFQYHAEQSGALPGATKWELMMEQNIPKVLKYTAWRRLLPCGKTEYKSITVAYDATASEFIDVYFDDDFRPNWDGMVVHHEVLEHGDFSQRQQVVRWIRRFPFKFLSDREYTIARRMFTKEDSLYGITKAITHPRAPHGSRITKVDHFHSMWRSRNIPCPWGTEHSACETLLLHHEQFKIPEKLARFAVRHGMWPFIRTLASVVPAFVEARRLRCTSSEADASAYGSGVAPDPPSMMLKRESSHTSLSSLATSSSTEASSLDSSGQHDSSILASAMSEELLPLPRGERERSSQQLARSSSTRHLKGVAAVAIVSSLAVLMNRKISASPSKGGSTGRQRKPHHVRPVGKRESLLNL